MKLLLPLQLVPHFLSFLLLWIFLFFLPLENDPVMACQMLLISKLRFKGLIGYATFHFGFLMLWWKILLLLWEMLLLGGSQSLVKNIESICNWALVKLKDFGLIQVGAMCNFFSFSPSSSLRKLRVPYLGGLGSLENISSL